MDVKNLTGLEKPLEKLIEVMAEGIGETANAIFKFDAKKLKRIGEAEAEVEKQLIIKKAEGSEKAVEILGRAGKRFALEQYNKQINLENIIIKTKDLLEGTEVSDEPVDRDWAFRFMNIAQDVSREDMQELLSKMLAGEITQPGTFSLRTLDFVKNISKQDILLLKKIAFFSDRSLNICIPSNNVNDGFLDITYAEILKMIEVGFIQPKTSSILKLGTVNVDQKFSFRLKYKTEYQYIFTVNSKQENLNIPCLKLTTIGGDVVSLLEMEQVDEDASLVYIKALKDFWETKGIIFSKKI